MQHKTGPSEQCTKPSNTEQTESGLVATSTSVQEMKQAYSFNHKACMGHQY